MQLLIFISFFLFVTYFVNCTYNIDNENDYYKLLGVPRDANVQEIRKAFKALAVKLHPDKNKDDEHAEAKFIKITKAYEVLKDQSTRKQYDLYGKTEFKHINQNYHSYTYYKNKFGIYDDDPLIVTLSTNDYEWNILDKNQIWFINFYSPQCYHCHKLAETWRQLAAELEGVIRIGAVNCEEDYSLCYQLRIESYPTLLFYEKNAHIYEGIKYHGYHTVRAFEEYVLSKISISINRIQRSTWQNMKNKNCLLFLCTDVAKNSPDEQEIIKITASLDAVLPVGVVTETSLCKEILDNYMETPIIYWHIDKQNHKPKIQIIKDTDGKSILNSVLDLLPHPPHFDKDKLLKECIQAKDAKPCLLCFYLGVATDLKLELKKLPALLPNINIGLVHCGKQSNLCATYHIVRYPTWGTIKQQGLFEMHQGRDILHEVVAFARDSAQSTNLHAITPEYFQKIRAKSGAWFIKWYAPWCPPCKRLAPEFRKASLNYNSDVIQFGSIDCTLHREFCSIQNIHSYPTMIYYNGSRTSTFYGAPSASGIIDFLENILNPIVTELNGNNFRLLINKSKYGLWAVNFYAPWCGPCQKLEPEWRKLAKMVRDENIKIDVAKVNCEVNEQICNTENIRSYPTIRLYSTGKEEIQPLSSSGIIVYNGQRNAIALKTWILRFLSSIKIEDVSSERKFIYDISMGYIDNPWLVNFHVEGCAACEHLEREFHSLRVHLQNSKIRVARIDCREHDTFCGDLDITTYPTTRLYLGRQTYYSIDSLKNNEILDRVKAIMRKVYHDEL